MEYIIQNIEPKRPGHSNRHRGLWVGRKCEIDLLMVGTHGRLVVEVEDDEWHTIFTTPVLSCEMSEVGIVFETENSVYTLAKESI